MTIQPFTKKIWLSSPTMHGEELEYMKQAYDSNWMSTLGENLNVLERDICEVTGCNSAVPLTTGTAAMHMAVKLAGIGRGDRVFCTDMTFAATVSPVIYEGGEPVFIDSERDTWNMSPEALEKAFELYPEVKFVIVAHLYGTPAKLDEIKAVCDRHGATLIEDAAESFGAYYKGRHTGAFGKYSALSFNGNKIITGSSGGMLITDDVSAGNKVRKWSTQSRDCAPWYQHSEIGYNYRMSNVIAGVVRGQLPYLNEHIEQKKAVYNRYKEGFKDLPVQMNPYDAENSKPNFWLSCLLIDKDAMCSQKRGDSTAEYIKEPGKTCPTEILKKLSLLNAEGRPVWKPMHLQPLYGKYPFVTAGEDVGADIFERGLCLPSDNKMTLEQVDKIVAVIHKCFA